MSLRICMLRFSTFNLKKNQYFAKPVYINSHFMHQYQFSASTGNIQTVAPEKVENMQFPKHVQPLANQSLEEILSSLSTKSLSEVETVSALKMLRMFTLFRNVKSDNFIYDQRFQVLCKIFEENCDIMHPNLLVSGLRSLLEVGMSPSSKFVVAAEKSIKRNINRFSTFNLIGCLYFHHKFTVTALQKDVVTLLKNELCKRISNISSNAEVLMLVHFLHIFSEEDQKKMQPKVVEMVKTLNVHELCKTFNTLAENSNRSIVILNTVAFCLLENNERLQIKEIVDLLYSFKKLNFFDLPLMLLLLDDVVSDIPSVTQPSTISGLLTICGHLRLRHIAVLNACAEWIIRNEKICRPKEFVSFVLTTATLNYNSLETHKALHTILPLVTLEKVGSSDVWLDYIWSLAILNIADKDSLLKVLSPDFYKPLIDNSGFEVATNKLKLMNLKTVLKNYYPECVFGCNLFLDPFEIPQSSEIENNRKHVIKVLCNLVPKDKYLCINLNTDMGIFIDAEFIMGKNRKPLPISKFGTLSKVTTAKPLPAGSQRIALLILFYKDFTLCSASRTGINDFTIRLLFSQGYTPVPISFAEFMRNKTEVKKAKYLLQRITDIMKKVEDNGHKFNIELFN